MNASPSTPLNAAPQPGDVILRFNGTDNYIEVPTSPDFSISTTGELSVSAWLRPDVLDFPAAEGTGYVHWMGKGDSGEQEWTFRIYSQKNRETPPRPNRISFYVFNPEGGLGVGSYFQDPIVQGGWIHVVGIAGSAQTYIYKDGALRRCDTYRGPAAGGCPAHTLPDSGDQLVINPQGGSAPLRIGTRDFGSFFQGAIRGVRIWNRAIQADEIQTLFASDVPSQDGLVAEYLLDADTGNTAADTAGGHNGQIFGAVWEQQT